MKKIELTNHEMLVALRALTLTTTTNGLAAVLRAKHIKILDEERLHFVVGQDAIGAKYAKKYEEGHQDAGQPIIATKEGQKLAFALTGTACYEIAEEHMDAFLKETSELENTKISLFIPTLPPEQLAMLELPDAGDPVYVGLDLGAALLPLVKF